MAVAVQSSTNTLLLYGISRRRRGDAAQRSPSILGHHRDDERAPRLAIETFKPACGCGRPLFMCGSGYIIFRAGLRRFRSRSMTPMLRLYAAIPIARVLDRAVSQVEAAHQWLAHGLYRGAGHEEFTSVRAGRH